MQAATMPQDITQLLEDWSRGDRSALDKLIPLVHSELRNSGTPAYMSPEQLESKELTTRSDIYSLGLVLYEIFTGKRAFEAENLPELIRLRRSDATPTNPSQLVANLDPLVERVIFRCLERDPADCPASTLQVAALPGGDPLQAALAAGETPSPAMVAATPKQGSLRPVVAASLLSAVILGLALVMLLSGEVALHRLAPLARSAESLKERAAELAKKLGYADAPVDTARGFSLDREFLFYARDRDPSLFQKETLRSGQPSAINFWYRQSQGYLEPFDAYQIGITDPPADTPGMVSVVLDTTGRLTRFEAVPPREVIESEGGATSAPDWQALLREAGLDPAALRPINPRWTPPQPSDSQVAWEGFYPARPDLALRIEAASYRGRPVYFEVVSPWSRASEESAQDKVLTILLLTLYFGTLALGALLAWRNLRLGRGDRKGAFRLALFIFVIRMIFWPSLFTTFLRSGEVSLLVSGLQSAVYWAFFIGLMYLALEPFIRRRWPEWIISWSRLLAGDFRDPLIGRDILVGALVGVSLMLLLDLPNLVVGWGGRVATPTGANLRLNLLTLANFFPGCDGAVGVVRERLHFRLNRTARTRLLRFLYFHRGANAFPQRIPG